jgi:predicted ester cyclase
MLLIPVLSNAQISNKSKKNTKNKEAEMSVSQKNKEVIRKLYEESLNKKDLELLADIISNDYVGVCGQKGAAAFQEPIVALFKAFPDIHWILEELFAEGDKVVVSWEWKGTHTGQFTTFAATNKMISNEGIAVYEVKDGKIIKAHIQTDRLGFLQQLDVLPLDLTALSKKKPNANAVSFIDKFLVPGKAKQEFIERVSIIRKLLRNLPGFIEDTAYERTDEQGNLIYITIAVWENEEVMGKAKETMQAEYKKQGFNPAEMMERLGISIDRGMYKGVGL